MLLHQLLPLFPLFLPLRLPQLYVLNPHIQHSFEPLENSAKSHVIFLDVPLTDVFKFCLDVVEFLVGFYLGGFGADWVVVGDEVEEVCVVEEVADVFPVKEVGVGEVDLLFGVAEEEEEVDEDFAVDEDSVFFESAEAVFHGLGEGGLFLLVEADGVAEVGEFLFVHGFFEVDAFGFFGAFFHGGEFFVDGGLFHSVILLNYSLPRNSLCLLIFWQILWQRCQIVNMLVYRRFHFFLLPLSPALAKVLYALLELFPLLLTQ